MKFFNRLGWTVLSVAVIVSVWTGASLAQALEAGTDGPLAGQQTEEAQTATAAQYAPGNDVRVQEFVKTGDDYVSKRDYVAASAAYFRAGEICYKTFEDIKLTARNADEVAGLIKSKTAALTDAAKYFGKVMGLGSGVWTIRATYMVGKGFYDMAEAVAGQTLFGNSEVEKMAEKVKILSSLDKYYDKAIEYFGQNIAFAKKHNLKDEYVEKSMQAMMEMVYRKGEILEQVGLVFKNSPIPDGLAGDGRKIYEKELEGRYIQALDAAKPVYENGLKIAKENDIKKSPWLDRIRERLKAITKIKKASLKK
jgi:tetratricopeptide (TPR) repeat protein